MAFFLIFFSLATNIDTIRKSIFSSQKHPLRYNNVHSLKYLIVQQFEFKVCKLCIIKFVFFLVDLMWCVTVLYKRSTLMHNYLVTMARNDPDSLCRNKNCHNKSKIDCDV